MSLVQAVQDVVPAQVKPVLDVVAATTAISAVVGALTTVFGLLAAIASFGWALIRIYETQTVQAWLQRRKRK